MLSVPIFKPSLTVVVREDFYLATHLNSQLIPLDNVYSLFDVRFHLPKNVQLSLDFLSVLRQS